MKNTVTHSVFSQDQDRFIAFFEKFNKAEIKTAIVDHLKAHPSDTLEHCKEYSEKEIKKYYGVEIINFYAVNPKSGQPSLVITKGDREYYKPLSN
jgi:hypothetical protein